DDIRAVMDAAGSQRAAVFGGTYSGPLACFFAASHPERTSALVLYNAMARLLYADDYTHALAHDDLEDYLEETGRNWGRSEGLRRNTFVQSSEARRRLPRLDPQLQEYFTLYQRMSISPGAAVAIQRMNFETDVRDILPVISVPTLVMHVRDNPNVVVGHGRYLAEHIPGAKYVELDGSTPMWWGEGTEHVYDEVEEFLTGARHPSEPDRVLATVLFTDVVSSTERLASLGDRRWRDVVELHDSTSRRQVERYRGR